MCISTEYYCVVTELSAGLNAMAWLCNIRNFTMLYQIYLRAFALNIKYFYLLKDHIYPEEILVENDSNFPIIFQLQLV